MEKKKIAFIRKETTDLAKWNPQTMRKSAMKHSQTMFEDQTMNNDKPELSCGLYLWGC